MLSGDIGKMITLMAPVTQFGLTVAPVSPDVILHSGPFDGRLERHAWSAELGMIRIERIFERAVGMAHDSPDTVEPWRRDAELKPQNTVDLRLCGKACEELVGDRADKLMAIRPPSERRSAKRDAQDRGAK